jgi:glycosyltransferase involved in cell wall biosynthesis
MAGNAAVLVDPLSVESISDGIRSVLTGEQVRQQLSEKGRWRSQAFTWARCASQILGVLQLIASY